MLTIGRKFRMQLHAANTCVTYICRWHNGRKALVLSRDESMYLLWMTTKLHTEKGDTPRRCGTVRVPQQAGHRAGSGTVSSQAAKAHVVFWPPRGPSPGALQVYHFCETYHPSTLFWCPLVLVQGEKVSKRCLYTFFRLLTFPKHLSGPS